MKLFTSANVTWNYLSEIFGTHLRTIPMVHVVIVMIVSMPINYVDNSTVF
jgi:hypothetical protein